MPVIAKTAEQKNSMQQILQHVQNKNLLHVISTTARSAPRDRFGLAAGAHSVRVVVDIAGINENNSLFQA